eukprot:FR739872.1.p1 GENE.FR739872.1~~FR739872.1.p1  ORF type:complete len:115 (+),score=17.82 FR739872.1:40-345(+)
MKKNMERQAIAAGCWDPKEAKEMAKHWSKLDLAVIVALHYTLGFPRHEKDWNKYLSEFPKRKKSDLAKEMNRMKSSGELFDMNLTNVLDAYETNRLLPDGC